MRLKAVARLMAIQLLLNGRVFCVIRKMYVPGQIFGKDYSFVPFTPCDIMFIIFSKAIDLNIKQAGKQGLSTMD